MRPHDFQAHYSLHDNALASLSFYPEAAVLVVTMDRPIDGGEGQRSLRFSGIQSFSITGSLSDGTPGFICGDGVLSLRVAEETKLEGKNRPLYRIQILFEALSKLTRPLTGLNVADIVCDGVHLDN
jgi:hypothetical protein